jgi:di/tricarboxylate transporter
VFAAAFESPAGMFLVPVLMYKLCPPEITDTPEAPKDAAKALEKMGPMSRDEKYMAGTMLFAVALWVSESEVGEDGPHVQGRKVHGKDHAVCRSPVGE